MTSTLDVNEGLKNAKIIMGTSSRPGPPQFASKLDEREWVKFRLAQAFRIFASFGYNEGAAGHITVRDPVLTDCFWVNPLGRHFALMQPSDLLLVDHNGNILPDLSGPERMLNTAAFMIHSNVHKARPDVKCAAHTHSTYGKAYSAFGRPLDMYTQDACAFFNDHEVYTQFNGVVLGDDEGVHIAKALGKKKAAILQNHGLIVATPSIEASVFFFIAFERACKVQLLVDAASSGSGRPSINISDADAAAAYQTNGPHHAGWLQGMTEFQLLEAKEGRTFELAQLSSLL